MASWQAKTTSFVLRNWFKPRLARAPDAVAARKVMTLLVKAVITFQMAMLMLVALLGLYFGFGVLIFIYRFVDRLK